MIRIVLEVDDDGNPTILYNIVDKTNRKAMAVAMAELDTLKEELLYDYNEIEPGEELKEEDKDED